MRSVLVLLAACRVVQHEGWAPLRPGGPVAAPQAPPRALPPRLSATPDVDVAVVGGGPAGYVAAALLARAQHSVALVDPAPEKEWPNNYGVWNEEWAALAKEIPELADCVRQEWRVTDCFFGGSFGMPMEERLRLDRAYAQVDRAKVKAALEATHRAGEVELITGSVQASRVAPNIFAGGLAHDADGSTLTVTPRDGGANRTLRARVVVDATGFESALTAREQPAAAGLWRELPPGYQIAYGMTVDVEEGGPYAPEAMTLFDYRTDHLDPADVADAEERPSFVYVMPGELQPNGKRAVFFEETSLVGRDERRLEFKTLQRRLEQRLAFLGIKYDPSSRREEEYCYIPMGGTLPDPSQRVVPVGGAANTVHPATGYQICRLMASASDVANALSAELRRGAPPDAVAAAAHAALWPEEVRLQRDLQVYGGEFLGSQRVDILRGFFSAFFALEPQVWGGFLAGRPGLPGNDNHESAFARLRFGLAIFRRFPPRVGAAFLGYLAQFTAKFGPVALGSLVPLPRAADPGTARDREVYVRGDAAAKREALAMLRDGRGEPSPQVELWGATEERSAAPGGTGEQ